MRISVILSEDILQPAPDPPSGYGAVVEFRGVVRPDEDGRVITGLNYEAYRGMAEREMERIARELLHRVPCLDVHIAHRVGHIPIGETAILVRATARHRKPALEFVALFMDQLKADVPIWKVGATSVSPE